MRHVSRTHSVALDWLFDRINLDPKNQITYIDTKNQLADVLTRGNFTRDEWKTETATSDRSGRPDKTSWRMVRKVRLEHEEILLDGTAQSVRYGGILRDRSGRPDNIISQEVARPQNSVMGNDET